MIRNSNYRHLNCPMKSVSRQLRSNSASSITHLPTGVVSAKLAAKNLSLAAATKWYRSARRIVALRNSKLSSGKPSELTIYSRRLLVFSHKAGRSESSETL